MCKSVHLSQGQTHHRAGPCCMAVHDRAPTRGHHKRTPHVLRCCCSSLSALATGSLLSLSQCTLEMSSLSACAGEVWEISVRFWSEILPSDHQHSKQDTAKKVELIDSQLCCHLQLFAFSFFKSLSLFFFFNFEPFRSVIKECSLLRAKRNLKFLAKNHQSLLQGKKV